MNLIKSIYISQVFFLTSCATDIVPTNHTENSNELSSSQSGVVAYNPQGLPELVKKRRENALTRISAFCRSDQYKITSEKTVKPEETQTSSGLELSLVAASEVKEIRFTCQ